jgi:hypothetical protein
LAGPKRDQSLVAGVGDGDNSLSVRRIPQGLTPLSSTAIARANCFAAKVDITTSNVTDNEKYTIFFCFFNVILRLKKYKKFCNLQE